MVVSIKLYNFALDFQQQTTFYSMETSYITQFNAERPATKRQLWALFALSKKCGEKHDYREDNLTMAQASDLIQKFNAKSTLKVCSNNRKKKTLEEEFLEYMDKAMEEIIATAKSAINIKSIVEDDPTITPKNKRKQYAFIGFGCGFTLIDFDKRSKVGKSIIELSNKHRRTTFLNRFLNAFTAQEKRYLDSIGCPLTALYSQDVNINLTYQQNIVTFMREKGVKNVITRTFDD